MLIKLYIDRAVRCQTESQYNDDSEWETDDDESNQEPASMHEDSEIADASCLPVTALAGQPDSSAEAPQGKPAGRSQAASRQMLSKFSIFASMLIIFG